ncbi:MAG: hypothetical protein VX335_04270 [Pseudomonadota bacterium]|nr:hypothetical protein [Pseudomonadota bacterium]
MPNNNDKNYIDCDGDCIEKLVEMLEIADNLNIKLKNGNAVEIFVTSVLSDPEQYTDKSKNITHEKMCELVGPMQNEINNCLLNKGSLSLDAKPVLILLKQEAMPENQLPMHNNKILQGIIDASKQRRPYFSSENIAPKNGCAPRTNKNS